jgi:hypothetical protein
MQSQNNANEKSLNDLISTAQLILNSEDAKYSNEEIKLITDLLWKFSELTLEVYHIQMHKDYEKSNLNGTGKF